MMRAALALLLTLACAAGPKPVPPIALGYADCTGDRAYMVVRLGPVTSEERAAIEAAAGALKGQRANRVDFIPPSAQGNLRTREQMEADGWFGDDD